MRWQVSLHSQLGSEGGGSEASMRSVCVGRSLLHSQLGLFTCAAASKDTHAKPSVELCAESFATRKKIKKKFTLLILINLN
jgi:hypothetical protein